MELNTDVLQYLSIAMKMPADAGEAGAAQGAGDSARAPASEVASEAAEHVQKSPKKKRRRFQPKRSPKKKAKAKKIHGTNEPSVEEGDADVADDVNIDSESEGIEG